MDQCGLWAAEGASSSSSWWDIYSGWARMLLQHHRDRSAKVSQLQLLGGLQTPAMRPAASSDLSTETHSTISDLSLTSGSPASPAELETLVTSGTTDSTPYKCSFCDRAYPRQTLMKLHEQTHTDQLPFECEYCSHRFKHKRSKDRHVKLHTGEKKFKCKYCPSAYCRSDHLKIHLRTHDKQKPYQCSVCNRGYRTAAALTSHQQRHKDNKAAESGNSQSLKMSDKERRGTCKQEAPATESVAAGLVTSQRTSHADESGEPISNVAAQADQSNDGKNVDETTAETTGIKLSHAVREPKIEATCPTAPALPKLQMQRSKVEPTVAPSSDLTGGYVYPRLHQMAGWDQQWSCPYCDRPTGFSNVEALSYHIQTFHVHLLMSMDNALLSGYSMSSLSRSTGLKTSLSPSLASATRSPDAPVSCLICLTLHPDTTALIRHIHAVHGHDDSAAAKRPSEQLPTDLSQRSVKRSRTNGSYSGTDDDAPAASGAESPIICSICSCPFAEFEAYRLHFQTAHLDTAAGLTVNSPGQQLMLTCERCSQQFSSLELLEPHLAAHLRTHSVRHSCQKCQRSYRSVEELHKHQMERHAATVYRCTICRAIFDTRADVQTHLAVTHSEEQRITGCSACTAAGSSDGFVDEAAFQRHLREVHMTSSACIAPVPAPSATHPCMLCGSHFDDLDTYKRHVQSHQRTMRCKICQQAFYTEFQMDRHMETVHASELRLNGSSGRLMQIPYPTELTTATSSTTATASTIAVELNPAYPAIRHKCNICDDLMPCARTLAQHKLSHCKVVLGDCCAICKGRIVSARDYKQHMKQHSAPSFPVACVICQQTLVSDLEVGIHAEFHLRHIRGGRGELVSSSPSSGSAGGDTDSVHGETTCRGRSRCPACRLQLETESEKRHHVCVVRNVPAGLDSTAAAAAHVPTGGRREMLQCVICRQMCGDEREMREHISEHLSSAATAAESSRDLQLLACSLCQTRLDSPLQLQLHLIEHNFEGCGSFACYICSAVFTTSAALHRHMHALHGAQARPFDCQHCREKFFFRAELEHHGTLHTLQHACRRLTDVAPLVVNSQAAVKMAAQDDAAADRRSPIDGVEDRESTTEPRQTAELDSLESPSIEPGAESPAALTLNPLEHADIDEVEKQTETINMVDGVST